MKDLAQRRVAAQWLVGSPAQAIADTARHLLATQAQDLPASKWALGLRTPGATLRDVDAGYAARQLVRGWPLRGTLHVCAAEDLAWLTQLTAERVIASSRRRAAELGLDAKVLARARDVAETALAGTQLTREQIYAAFARGKLDPTAQRGYHMLWHLALTGTVCLTDDRYALCAEWLGPPRVLDRDAALRELALRYFRSHGPATQRDLQRWAKLGVAESKTAVALARPELAASGEYLFAEGNAPAGKALLALPGFDELILGYADRTCTVAAEHASTIVPGGNGVFLSTLVANGVAIGTWVRTVARTKAKQELVIELRPLQPLSPATRRAALAAVATYAAFVGLPMRAP